MPTIHVFLNATEDNPPWPDIARGGRLVHSHDDWQLAVLDGGMSSGEPSVALRLDVELIAFDGRVPIVTETSLAAWISATAAIRGRYPDAFRGGALDPDMADAVIRQAERIARAVEALDDGDPTEARDRARQILQEV